MTNKIKSELSIKILRGFQAIVFCMAGICVSASGKASAQMPDPQSVKDAAQTVAGLNSSELLALVALACVALAFYLVWAVQREIRALSNQLAQRPCVRDPKND